MTRAKRKRSFRSMGTIRNSEWRGGGDLIARETYYWRGWAEIGKGAGGRNMAVSVARSRARYA